MSKPFSIMRLRQAIAKPKPDKKEDELIEAMWQNLKGDRESLGEHLQSNMMEPRSSADGKEPSSNVDAPMEPRSKSEAIKQERTRH